MQKILIPVVIAFLPFGNAYATFDWGSGCEGGSGTFQQQIVKNGIVEIGQIPSGVTNVYINLTSSDDLDVQLIDKASGDKIIAWAASSSESGLLSGSSMAQTTYRGVAYEWSGYGGNCSSYNWDLHNSDSCSFGNEYIKISGTSNRSLTMKAFGFESGYAKVDYSWDGKEGCEDTSKIRSSGNFSATLARDKRSYLGIIPAGIDNPVVFLKATDDLDVELYDAVTNEFVVGWKSDHIDSSRKITGTYQNDKITWSGWNGRYGAVSNDTKTGINISSEQGREYIRIHGKSINGYKMYVYAYQDGSAEVEYSWGINPIYAGIWGMGTDYLKNDSNNNMLMFEATNGIAPSYMTRRFGDEYAGYGHTLAQANLAAQGYKNMKGQIGIALKLSNYARGSGDISNYTSGNVQYIYNKIKSQINENSNNVVFVSGHSSGGGDAQDVLWKFKAIGQPVKASFQIDSVETEISNYGDAKIPNNTEHAYNYYEDEVWYVVVGPREARIYAEDSSKTSITNTYISDPKCNTDGNWTCTEDGHEAIDNDIRVWGDILTKMKNYAGIKFGFFE